MEVNPYAVEVTERFRKHFKEIYDFIQQQSYQSSQKLQKDIVDLVAEICERPHSSIVCNDLSGNSAEMIKFFDFGIIFMLVMVNIKHVKKSIQQ